MCSQEDKVGGYCVLEAVLAYTMGWWQQNEVGVWGQGRRGRHLLEQPESCIINSHPVVLSVSNPTGIKRTMHGQLHCTIVPRMFSLCFIYMIAHHHLCKALCLFSAHDKQPSVNEQTVLIIPLSPVTAQYSVSSGRCTQTLQVILKLSYSCRRRKYQSKFKVYWIPHCYTHLPARPQHCGKPRPWSVEESVPP